MILGREELLKALKNLPIAEIDTQIGRLILYSLTFGAQSQMRSALIKPIPELTSQVFMRELIKHICYPASSVNEDKDQPAITILTDTQVNNLSDGDFERIASAYLLNNEYLYSEPIDQITTATNGDTSIIINDIKYPKLENETSVDYLHRLCGIKQHADEQSNARMIKVFRHFSNDLARDIRDTFTMGETLRKAVRPLIPTSIESQPVNLATNDIATLARQNQERNLKPLNDLADKLDKLIDNTSLAANFMVESNEVQTSIAEELKVSGDKAASYSRANLNISILIIILTVVSIGFPVFVYFQARRDSALQAVQTEKYVKSITTAINDASAKGHNLSNKATGISTTGTENTKLNQIIRDLRLQNQQSEARLQLVEKRIRELEKRSGK